MHFSKARRLLSSLYMVMKRANEECYALKYLPLKIFILLCTFASPGLLQTPNSSSPKGKRGRAEMGVEMTGNGLSEGRKTEKVKTRVAEKGLRRVNQEGEEKSL